MRLIISCTQQYAQAALLWENQLIDYQKLPFKEKTHQLGDIVLAVVKERVPGLDAVFMDIGEAKPAFMPVSKKEKTTYRPGMERIVQIRKEAYAEKGPEVTEHLSVTGASVVLTPQVASIGVSAKITEDKERQRLRNIGQTFPQAESVGYILRTESRGKSVDILQEEAKALYGTYQNIVSRAKFSRLGDTLYTQGTPLGRWVLSFPTASIEGIVVDDPRVLASLQEEIVPLRPALKERFHLFQDAKWTVFDVYSISSQLQKATQKRVLLPGGGYLFIEETQALAAIDVNTGKALTKADKEAAISQFNLKAIPTIVQQILLRNLSGIILIDFIDMDSKVHEQQVLEALKDEFAKDRHVTRIMGFTRLKLVEISRERRGASLSQRLGISS